MKVHFIAIGGSAMHNLAIALHKKGHEVSGSDDEIFDPSRSRLEKYKLLPPANGWDTRRIHQGLDAVILGMHARSNNPELKKANALGLKIYSFPEFLYQQTKNKLRVVIGGSHGKTTITSMIMHVLKFHNIKFDYLVGALVEGFETMAEIDKNNNIAIFEGDEYLSSALDKRPKFHLYQAQIGLISGIAWDHINVFPTFEQYKRQFEIFATQLPEKGALIYFQDDKNLREIVKKKQLNAEKVAYSSHENMIKNGKTFLIADKDKIPVYFFGQHNMQNVSGALEICKKLGISSDDFYTAIKNFKGASRRLEEVAESEKTTVFFDFAHSPSKLKATTLAVKNQFPNRQLIACMELHTFSSLNKKFLKEYQGSMDSADEAIIFYNPETIRHKKLQDISPKEVKQAFGNENLQVFNQAEQLWEYLYQKKWPGKNLLIMSSGNFSGTNIRQLAQHIVSA